MNIKTSAKILCSPNTQHLKLWVVTPYGVIKLNVGAIKMLATLKVF